jgi:hypothetical protein
LLTMNSLLVSSHTYIYIYIYIWAVKQTIISQGLISFPIPLFNLTISSSQNSFSSECHFIFWEVEEFAGNSPLHLIPNWFPTVLTALGFITCPYSFRRTLHVDWLLANAATKHFPSRSVEVVKESTTFYYVSVINLFQDFASNFDKGSIKIELSFFLVVSSIFVDP